MYNKGVELKICPCAMKLIDNDVLLSLSQNFASLFKNDTLNSFILLQDNNNFTIQAKGKKFFSDGRIHKGFQYRFKGKISDNLRIRVFVIPGKKIIHQAFLIHKCIGEML